jgi:hypothetical protein
MPVVAFITHHDGQYSFQVYDIDLRGKHSHLTYDHQNGRTHLLGRKCKEAVANTVSEWKWVQIE